VQALLAVFPHSGYHLLVFSTENDSKEHLEKGKSVIHIKIEGIYSYI
jgi:hypothetical protein